MHLDPRCQIEDKGPGHLHHRVGAVGRNVRHYNAVFPRRLDVHHIVSGRADTHITDLGEAFKNLPRDRYLVGHDDLAACQPVPFFILGRIIVNCHVAQAAERLPADVARIYGSAFKYHAFFHEFVSL